MATARARRKTRNPASKVKRSTANRRARRAAVPQSIPHILQAHWDKTATVRENYANLGIMRTLNGPMNQCADGVTATRTGAIGSDEIVSACDVLPLTEHMDPEEWSAELDGGLAAKQMQGKQQRVSCVDSTVKVQVEGQVEADAVDGNDNSDVEFVEEGELEHDADGNVIGVKITRRRVVKEKVAGVSDDAAAVDQRLSRANASSVIDALESYAAEGNSIKRTRYLSEFEVAFVEECMRKHGRDFKAMARNIKLNAHQLTPKQIAKKFALYDKAAEDENEE